MLRKTDHENAKIHFQIDRFVQQNSEWFYITREGKEQGPFLTKYDAQGDLTALLIDLIQKEKFGH